MTATEVTLDDNSDDEEYVPDSDSCHDSSGASDSSDLDSDESGGGYESYGLADL